ncbi:MAG: hypothetical protein ACOYMR_10580 [Ilumatobacteraceae bacterium]
MRGVTAEEGDIDTATPPDHDHDANAAHAAEVAAAAVPPSRGRMLAVLAAGALGALIPQTWFRAGTFIAAGDTFPELRGLGGITRFWGTDITGTGSTGYPSSRLLERGIVQLVDSLGGAPELAQRLWFTVVLAVLAASVAWMASALVRHPAAVFVAGTLGVLNPFVLVRVPNVQPLIALGAMAILIGIVVRLGKEQHVTLVAALALAVWAAPLARTPPLLLLVVVVGTVSFGALLLAGAVAPVLRLSAVIVAGSLFWALPFALHHLLGTPGVHPIVADGPEAFRWAQAHGGPTNVITLVAWWLWGEPTGGAALVRLSSMPWSLLRWALPVAVVVSLALTWRRRGSQVLAVALFVLFGFAVGANAPFGPVNDFFLDMTHLDGVFREPMTKFGLLMVLCFALAVAFGVEDAMERWAARADHPEDTQPLPYLVALCVIAVVFVHPLLTGEVIPGERETLPSARVTLPASWTAAGEAIDALPGEAATLVLPLSDRYHRGTTWGFYGIDDLVSRVSDRPAYELLPAGYQEPDGASPDLMRQAESALANGDGGALSGAMRALGARYLAVRTDVSAAVGSDHTFLDGAHLLAAAQRLGLQSVGSFEHVQLFEVPPAARFAAASGSVAVISSTPQTQTEAVAVAAASATDGSVVTDDGPLGAAWVPTPTEEVLAVNLPAGEYRARAISRGPSLWAATVTDRSVRLVPSDTASVGGVSLLDDVAIDLDAPRRPFALLVGNDPSAAAERSLVPLDAGADGVTEVQLASGAPVSLLTEAPSTVDFTGAVARGCGRMADDLPRADASDADVEADGTSITISTRRASACLTETVRVPTPLEGHRRWVLSFTVTADEPAAVRVCMHSSALGGCLPGSSVAVDRRSTTVRQLVDSTDELGDVQLVLGYAPSGPTTAAEGVEFTDIALSPLQEAGSPVTVPRPMRDSTAVTAAQGRNTVIDSTSTVGELLGAFGDRVVDCDRYDDGPAVLHLDRSDEDGSLRLSANRHSACVAAPIAAPAGVRDVALSFEYQTGDEHTARVALMDASTGEVLDSRRLPASTFWTGRELRFVLPPAPVGRDETLQLVLAADGPRAGERSRTVDVAYRRVRMLPTQPFAYAVLPLTDPVAAEGTVVVGIDDRFVSVRGDGEVLLTFRQAFDDGWQLEGLPAGATATHERVDGWANGWRIDGLDGRAAVLEVRFRLQWWVDFAVWTAPVVWLLVALCTEWGRGRRRAVRAAAELGSAA